MELDLDELRAISMHTSSRITLWQEMIEKCQIRTIAEIGVWKGEFAEAILRHNTSVNTYFMIDPWRKLRRWDKPANVDSESFERFMQEADERTKFAVDKRVMLRGTTQEVVDHIPDSSLDCAYIDGDHSLRGITLDLQLLYPKVRDGGIICGDDFCPSIWQHPGYEPTFVFPYAVFFAEACSDRIYGLPHRQFLLHKLHSQDYRFIDLAGAYGRINVMNHLTPRTYVRQYLMKRVLQKIGI